MRDGERPSSRLHVLEGWFFSEPARSRFVGAKARIGALYWLYCIEALKKPPLGGFGMRMGGKAGRVLYQICHQGLLLVLTLPPG